jgi:hypothetical protein
METNDLGVMPTKNGSLLSFKDYKNIFFNYAECFIIGLIMGAIFL